MMNKIKLAIICCCLASMAQAQFRVVGYIHSGKQMPDISMVNFQKITHLNIAFVNPDSIGNLVLPGGLDSLTGVAHANKAKVLLSIGGGSHNPYYSKLLTDGSRGILADKLAEVVTKYNLDGLDVDLENDVIDNNYENFVKDLSARLKPINKLLTAAVATWNGEKISDASLKQFDFINIMSYDETGPWAPQRPGQHSSYEKAVNDLFYWTVTRKLPKEKANLGLPFYAYCFDTKYDSYFSFAEIVSKFPGNESKDEIRPQDGGAIYYNGVATIRKKTQLAKEKAAGVMIWELRQDDPGKFSLLNAIDQQINSY
jgi:chitinase